ncbi:hypothetical protein ACWDUN_12660 [Mycobacterium sp. NPDC003323]
MCAAPARHRATRANEQLWSAKSLLIDGDSIGSARHARSSSSGYALHVGRVGALAVSLGVGLAIANAGVAQPAHADTGTGTGSQSSASETGDGTPSAGPRTPKTEPADRKRGPRSATVARTATASSAQPTETADAGEEVIEPTEPADADEASDGGTGSSGDTAAGAPERASRSHPETIESMTVRKTVTAVLQAAPQIVVETAAVPDDDVEQVPAETPAAETPATPAVQEPKPSAGALTPKMTAAGVTLNTQSANTPTPLDVLVNSMFAWVARQISHTFANRTPVAGPIVYEQNALGQVYIDLNATDPNGDVLNYDIVQPEKGWVYRDLISGRFVYTPWELVTGQPLTDSFTIVVRDDSEHLPGVLGQIQDMVETVTRFLGFAQADNLTVSVPVTVDPVYQAPPLVTPIVGGGYKLGEDPAHIVSTVDIVDGDSGRLKQVVIKIATLAQTGDTLSYTAPADNPVIGTWDAETLTLTLSGVATLAQYEDAIEAVTFSATQGALLVRGLSIAATDEDDVDNIAPGFVTVAVWAPATLPPLVTPIAGGGFTIGDGPAKIVSAVDIIDGDSGRLSKLTVKITTLAQSGDVLGYVAPSGNPITATWDAVERTLTLTGDGTLAQYEEALQAVTFSATQGAALVRGLSISATDEHGIANIAPGFVTVGVWSPTRLVPLVTPIGGRSYSIGDPPMKPVAAVGIVDGDSSHLQQVTVRVTTFGKDGDTLAFGGLPDNPVTAAYDGATRTLTLSGIATKQQYEDALRAVTFTATQGGWTTRTILIVATDTDGVNSAPGSLTLSVW